MRAAQEEIYITMVVVKRPVKVGQAPLDPTSWAQTVLDSLAAQGMEHQVYTVTQGPTLPGNRFSPPPWNQLIHQRREPERDWRNSRSKNLLRSVCLVLSLASFLMAIYFLILHSRG